MQATGLEIPCILVPIHATVLDMDQYKTRMTLLQRVRDQQDNKSWDEFIQVYQDYIYAIIRRMGISEHDAHDIHQQVILNLWKSLPELDFNSFHRFRSVISTITRNRVIDFMRKRTSQADKLERAAKEETLDYLKHISVSEVDEIAEREWEIYLTNLVIERVEPRFSGQALDVFRLSMQGKTNEEISEQLDIKVSSVYRLRNRVKACMIDEIKELRKELE